LSFEDSFLKNFFKLSIIVTGVGLYCVGESNVFHQLKETTVYPGYIAGAQLVPISWGMHVAAWIQKKNKK
jgi:hypothetical protein